MALSLVKISKRPLELQGLASTRRQTSTTEAYTNMVASTAYEAAATDGAGATRSSSSPWGTPTSPSSGYPRSCGQADATEDAAREDMHADVVVSLSHDSPAGPHSL